jgi:hypothetical protein
VTFTEYFQVIVRRQYGLLQDQFFDLRWKHIDAADGGSSRVRSRVR